MSALFKRRTVSPPSNNNMDDGSESSQVYLTHEKSSAPPETTKASERAAELSFSVLLAAIAGALEAGHLSPNQRPIPTQYLEDDNEYIVNQVFSENLEGETVSDVLCLVLAIIIPSFVQIGICYYTNNRQNIHKTICVYLCGIGLTAMLTNCIKLYVGYLRPIFMDQCQPDDTYEDCTSDNEREMRLSFPSGHASVSFCGLCLFSYFLEHQFGISASRILIYDKPSGQLVMAHQSVKYKRIVSILCYSPIFLACFIAASRVVDNYHFPADVVGGTVLGGSVSLLVHGIWFPSWPTIEAITATP